MSALFFSMTVLVPLSAQQPATWRVSPKPILQIGEAEGDSSYMFFRARNATRLADSRILVLNAGFQQFRIYDARGKIVSSRGRRGRGPGEFNSPARLTMPAPDTVAVFDGGRQKLYTFHTRRSLRRRATAPGTRCVRWLVLPAQLDRWAGSRQGPYYVSRGHRQVAGA